MGSEAEETPPLPTAHVGRVNMTSQGVSPGLPLILKQIKNQWENSHQILY